MPLEINPELKQVPVNILQWLGIPSLTGFLGLYGTWLAFPPELVVDGIIDKSKKFSSESKIKNNGRLPAYSIKADVNNLCAKFAGVTLKNCGVRTNHIVVARLSHSESSEISIHPGLDLGDGTQISEFSYLLILKYQVNFFLKARILKKMESLIKQLRRWFFMGHKDTLNLSA